MSYRTAMNKNSLKKKGETVKKLSLRWQYLMVYLFIKKVRKIHAKLWLMTYKVQYKRYDKI